MNSYTVVIYVKQKAWDLQETNKFKVTGASFKQHTNFFNLQIYEE